MSPYADHDSELPRVGFAAALHAQRQAAGLTQEELAKRAGIGVRTVRELERGRVARPQRGTVDLLAEALGLAGPARDAFLSAAGHPAPAGTPLSPLSPGSRSPSCLPFPPGASGDPREPADPHDPGDLRGRAGPRDARDLGDPREPTQPPHPAGPPSADSAAAAGRMGPGQERPGLGVPIPLPTRPDLIGRDRDLAELEDVLTTADLVTLVGLAGVGKTCLALNVAHRAARPTGPPPAGVPPTSRLQATQPGLVGLPRVAAVAVSDVSGADDILATVAAVFGIGRAVELAERLGSAPVLLLVDGIDRAPRASTEAIEWLRMRVPGLKILATSRLPPGIAGGVEWRVEPLDVPPPEAEPELTSLRRYPAVALFLVRLRQVRREPVTPAEVPALATLVRRLGGLPLALELAAARGRVLDVRELLERYGDRVLDLGGAEPDGERLRDAVAASYRLLDPDEQYALRRLSVFRGRWSLELAEALLGDRPDLDVEAILDRFVGLGLVSVRGPGELRFRLLDVVSDFAGEACASAGELPAARGRHAEVVTRVAVRVSAELVGPTLAAAVARLDHLNSDIRAALAYASRREPSTALRLAAATPRWCRFRGRDREARALLRQLLDDPRGKDGDPVLRAWAQLGAAMLAAEHGEGLIELPATESALSTFLTHGDVAGELAARSSLCGLWQAIGGFDEARRHGEALLTLAVRTGRVREVAVAQNNLTWHDIRVGDLATAARRLLVAAQRAHEAGDARLRSLVQANLAEVARLDGRYAEAVDLARRLRAGIAEYGDPGHRVRLLGTLGQSLAEDGRAEEAVAVLDELASAADAGEAASSATAASGIRAMILGYLALARGDRTSAAGAFAAAADGLAGRHDARDVLEALVGVAASVEDPAKRASTLEQVVAVCDRGGLSLLPRDRALLNFSPMELAGPARGLGRYR